jgi:hypothetical protein
MTTADTLTAAALLDIKQQAEAASLAIWKATDDIARFATLCDVLREHGLEFDAGITAHGSYLAYTINMRDQQARHAGEMMLTLAALDCEESEYQDGLNSNTTTRITGPHAPDFFLCIKRPPETPACNPGESCHAEPGWAAVQNSAVAA